MKAEIEAPKIKQEAQGTPSILDQATQVQPPAAPVPALPPRPDTLPPRP